MEYLLACLSLRRSVDDMLSPCTGCCLCTSRLTRLCRAPLRSSTSRCYTILHCKKHCLRPSVQYLVAWVMHLPWKLLQLAEGTAAAVRFRRNRQAFCSAQGVDLSGIIKSTTGTDTSQCVPYTCCNKTSTTTTSVSDASATAATVTSKQTLSLRLCWHHPLRMCTKAMRKALSVQAPSDAGGSRAAPGSRRARGMPRGGRRSPGCRAAATCCRRANAGRLRGGLQRAQPDRGRSPGRGHDRCASLGGSCAARCKASNLCRANSRPRVQHLCFAHAAAGWPRQLTLMSSLTTPELIGRTVRRSCVPRRGSWCVPRRLQGSR